MDCQIVTLSTKGQLVIPAEIRTKLGIHPGTRIAVILEGNRIVLRPVSEQLIDETMGIFAGGTSMADELQQERRADKW
jgi:AbrB family looped-hinge helix DNA binding protein